MREESIDAASAAGKGSLSSSVIFVLLYSERLVRAHAVLNPKTPEPSIRIEEGIGFDMLVEVAMLLSTCGECF